MPTKVIMPQMGESIFEGTITKWLKKVGEKISRDEPLFEISTDKVDSEIPSPASGVVKEILFPEGQTVQINTVVAVIGGEGEGGTHEQAKQAPMGTAPAFEGAPAVLEEPEQVPPKVPAEKPVVPTSGVKSVDAPSKPPAEPASETRPPVPPPPPAWAPSRDIRTSPLVRRLARENNIDLSKIRGTGLEGRITKQDILGYLQQHGEGFEAAAVAAGAEEPEEKVVPEPEMQPAPAAPSAAVPTSPGSAPVPPRFSGDSETVAMTPMRKAISEHMVLSKRTAAHVHTVFEVDMTSVVRLRDRHKDDFEKREGVKLTFTPFFVKALVDTVREFPIVNASVSGDSVIFKKPINVGIAVALENGLIVPVVKDAQLKSFTGLVLAIQDLAERARTKRLRPDDVQNGTISITNPGPYGSLFGTPIINQPQVAIMGIGGIEKRPVVVDDAIAIRSMVYLSFGFDHRVIDGAVADQFMARVKSRLEAWAQWKD
jgi:2-oxoglutarate dehydrogenase E2 component (dihydrolipoamide succinyltransferase)